MPTLSEKDKKKDENILKNLFNMVNNNKLISICVFLAVAAVAVFFKYNKKQEFYDAETFIGDPNNPFDTVVPQVPFDGKLGGTIKNLKAQLKSLK
tara:strand:- start:1511 stop:1795 length:285 start_codon:yes stop_codon:yes gene_type:complete